MATMDISLNVFEMLAYKARKWFVIPTPPLFDAPTQGEHRSSGWNLSPQKLEGYSYYMVDTI